MVRAASAPQLCEERRSRTPAAANVSEQVAVGHILHSKPVPPKLGAQDTGARRSSLPGEITPRGLRQEKGSGWAGGKAEICGFAMVSLLLADSGQLVLAKQGHGLRKPERLHSEQAPKQSELWGSL